MTQALQFTAANRLLTDLLGQAMAPDLTLSADSHALLTEAAEAQRADSAAHMRPSLAPYSMLGMQLAVLHQGNLLSSELYPALQQAEQQSLDWLKQLFNMPYGQFSHGGSYNNLQALWQARDLSRNRRRTVYASRAAHYSLEKACRILGLALELIETDTADRISPAQLAEACRQQPPLAIIATLGTTAAGALDPLPQLAELAEQYQCWLHIDAAWGGSLLLLPEHHALLAPLRRADSLGFDPHKSLFQPRPCSVYLSRHAPAQTSQTDYLARAPSDRLSGSYGAEVFLPLWLNLQQLGPDWFIEQTRERLQQAARFADLMRETDAKVDDGGSGIVCFSGGAAISETLQQSGVLSAATLNKKPVCRVVFAGSQTRAEAVFRAIHPSH